MVFGLMRGAMDYAVGGGEEAGGVDCATGGGQCYYSSDYGNVGVHVGVTLMDSWKFHVYNIWPISTEEI